MRHRNLAAAVRWVLLVSFGTACAHGSSADDGNDSGAPAAVDASADDMTEAAPSVETGAGDVVAQGEGGSDGSFSSDATSGPEGSLCTPGAPCAPTNPCHAGTTASCSGGVPVCQDTGMSASDGTSCGADGVCVSGICQVCGSTGQYCCSGQTCPMAPSTCLGSRTSSCRASGTAQCVCGRLQQGTQLQSGDELWSCDGRFWLTLQGDGNLALYQKGVSTALWSAATTGKGAVVALMQDDGNFVAYTASQTPIWSTGTNGANCGTSLSMQNDGNLVVYDSGGHPIWATGTM
jgi:hypothetical protein